ncbi:hypothetical protein GCM10027591_06300 [Zhihengliuella somnathii]
MAVASYGLPATADVNTVPEEPTEAAASIINTSLLGAALAGAGESRATFPSNPGPDSGALDASLLGSEVIELGGINIPITDIFDFGEAGALQSLSEASSELDGHAITSAVGADGSLSLDAIDNASMGNMRLDVVQLANSLGVGDIQAIVDQAYLEIGAVGAEVEAIDGAFQDPDGVGGDGQYKVADLVLAVQSQAVADMLAQMVDAISSIDGALEDSINEILAAQNLLDPITSALPAGVTVDATVNSDVSGAIEEAFLSGSLTDETSIIDIDPSTGMIYIDMAEFMGNDEGAGTNAEGLNSQNPNTELIDDNLYPMVADSIHDIIENAIALAVSTVEASLGSISVDLTVDATSPLGGTATKTISAALDGTITSTACESTGIDGAAACTLLDTAEAAISPLLSTVVQTISNTLLANDGAMLYDLFTLIKTDSITAPIRAVLDPFIQILADNVLSVQLNRQVSETCTLPDGTTAPNSLEVSAISIGAAPSIGGARLNLGTAGVRMDACDEYALITPAITADPASIPAGDATAVSGTDFTPEADVTVQLVDADGNPVGEQVTVTTDGSGAFTTDLPVAADVPPGDYTIEAVDVTTGIPATAPLTVTQPDVQELNIGLDPPTVPAGDPTTATGTGYTPDSTASVQLVDPAGAPVGDSITVSTDANGEFTTEVPVPADAAPGDYTVVGTDDSTGNSAEAALTVTEPTATDIGSIGDFVWDDLNADGVQDADERVTPCRR